MGVLHDLVIHATLVSQSFVCVCVHQILNVLFKINIFTASVPSLHQFLHCISSFTASVPSLHQFLHCISFFTFHYSFSSIKIQADEQATHNSIYQVTKMT
ncbi:hypothetical protein BsWGS_27313 [Bradybaena similaris]